MRTGDIWNLMICIPPNSRRWYYRVYCVDCSEDDVVSKLKNMFDVVFHQMAMRVIVEHDFEDGSLIAQTVGALRELPILHFTK